MIFYRDSRLPSRLTNFDLSFYLALLVTKASGAAVSP